VTYGQDLARLEERINNIEDILNKISEDYSHEILTDIEDTVNELKEWKNDIDNGWVQL